MQQMKSREVLVLNKGWTAVGIVSLERAIVMLFSSYRDGTPKAKIIDPAHDFQQFTWADWSALEPASNEDVIKTAKCDFRVPEVILLTRFDKLPMQKVNFSRRTLCRRDDYTCQYCSKKLGGSEWTVDHVKPRAQGGLTTWDNCVLACVECNSTKANRTPEQANMKLKCVPKKPTLNICRRGARKVESWRHFLSEIYYETELENDNEE